eukprot:709455-Prymnesium_polylepis.1
MLAAQGRSGRKGSEPLDLTGGEFEGLKLKLSKKEKELIKEKRARDGGGGGGGGGGPGKGKKPTLTPEKPAPVKPARVGQEEKTGGDKHETFYERKDRILAELVTSKGMKDGKKPCYYFHHAGSCRFSAGECNQGYH